MDEGMVVNSIILTIILMTFWRIAKELNYGLHTAYKVSIGQLFLLKRKIATSNFDNIGAMYNDFTKSLGKAEFDFFKRLGLPNVSISKEHISKGTPRLMELIRKSKMFPKGKVLDLCSGRGGWDAAIAPLGCVDQIISVTLGPAPGRQGHEEYTRKAFEGKEKVHLVYGDICDMPCQFADTVLFDGGEQKSDKVKEANDFYNLFSKGVVHQIRKDTDFILKILTPTDPRILKLLLEIQELTGRGTFYRSNTSKNTSMELYFISSRGTNMNLQKIVRRLLEEVLGRAILGEKLPPIEMQYSDAIPREKVLPTTFQGFTLPKLTPLSMENSIAQLSQYQTADFPTRYLHWESLGTYVFGNKGSATINQMQKIMKFVNHLVPSLPGFLTWKTTDTTPQGFQEIFKEKVDMPPLENSPYDKKRYAIYLGLASYFKQRGFKYRELTYDEVEKHLNKKGVASVFDGGVENIREFLLLPNWRELVEETRKQLNLGKPINGIFTTIGKREKKKTLKETKGSRMVAFLPIATRILELKIFGKFIELTKPTMNKMGVGGLGLHDFGMRLAESWKGCASSSDIAGFDTKISVKTLSMENHFSHLLGAEVTAMNMFRLYAFPHILVPKISQHTRMELLRGHGQRMSGTQITYPFNTITRQVLTILQYGESRGWSESDYLKNTIDFMKDKTTGGCISGDDEVFSAPTPILAKYSEYGRVLNESGFIRKDVNPMSRSTVHHTIEEVQFCSHNYERVSYFDAYTAQTCYRYMPTRDVTEIIGKSTLRVGGDGLDHLSSDAWISMQGVNLLVLYHHMRLPRMLGSLYKSITPPNLILTDLGGSFLHRPWMRQGEILDVINDVLFGDSTAYPPKIPGFRVREFGHCGYLPMARNILYDPLECRTVRAKCKVNLYRTFKTYYYEGNNSESLDPSFMTPYLPEFAE